MSEEQNIASKLIDKIGAVYHYYNDPHKIKSIAMNAFNNVVEEIAADENISREDKLLFLAKLSDAGKMKNVTDIVRLALPQIEETANPKLLDEDWILDFLDKASHIKSDIFQTIWARILAEEVNSPNRISKRLLHNLYLMGRQDADNFLNLSRFCFWDKYNNLAHPLIYIKGHESEYAHTRITTEILNELEQFSLIETNYETGFAFSKKKELLYTNHYILIEASKIPAGNVRLTRDGQTLFSIIEKQNNNQILAYTLEKLEYGNCDVKVITK